MSKQQMSRAKALIDKGKYKEAKIVLRRVDHPTAREWEQRLDAMIAAAAAAKPEPGTLRRMWNISVILLVAVLVVIGGMYWLTPPSGMSVEQIAKRYTGNDAYVEQQSGRMRVVYSLLQADETAIVRNSQYKMSLLLCKFQEYKHTDQAYKLDGTAQFSDALGNETRRVVVSATFSADVITELNCRNQENINPLAIGEDVFVDPALQQ